MQVQKPNSPAAVGLKRARMQSFPRAFEEQLLRLFAARSAFLQAQLECVGEDASSGGLQLPEGIGSLWLDCILTPPPELQKADDETIVEYLKASAFFQDCYMVKQLCTMLGSRLLKAHSEAAGTSSSDQQPATVASTMHHISQVLGQLSCDLVMDVLRSAPGSLQEQLPRLPQSLASLAALAHIPSLAARCSPARDCPDQGASVEHAELALCVCTNTAEPVAVASADEEAADSPAATSMWLQKSHIVGNIFNGLFTLESRPGVVVCRLVARVSALQGVTVCLPDSACLLLGPGALKLQGVTFQGGAVVCSGASCRATFEDTSFDRCSLLVLSAAQATLSKAAFSNMAASQSDLAMFVHGVSSKVVVQSGTVAGGTQGVDVQAGGHLDATGLTITGVCAIGAEVQGESSCLSLTDCSMYDFEEVDEEVAEDGSDSGDEAVMLAMGVLVNSSSSAHLSSLSVSSRHVTGVGVGGGEFATLDNCKVSDSDSACVRVCGGATGRLTSCTLSEGGWGLLVNGSGSSVHAGECQFRQNECGASTTVGAALTAVACTTSQNEEAGFTVSDRATVVELTDCASDSDGVGCSVSSAAKLRATRVKVTNSIRRDGYHVWLGGDMVLTDCSAEGCSRSGVRAVGQGSKMHAEGCTFKQNGACGVVARNHAVGAVKGCHSSQHSSAGYHAAELAQMKVSSSVSEGDKQGCSVAEGGQLTLEEVTVDGTPQSGQLP